MMTRASVMSIIYPTTDAGGGVEATILSRVIEAQPSTVYLAGPTDSLLSRILPRGRLTVVDIPMDEPIGYDDVPRIAGQLFSPRPAEIPIASDARGGTPVLPLTPPLMVLYTVAVRYAATRGIPVNVAMPGGVVMALNVLSTGLRGPMKQAILETLYGEPGHTMNVHKLVEKLGSDYRVVSTQLKILANQGLVERIGVATVRLTEAGRVHVEARRILDSLETGGG